ncbi:MAG: hypothetical protein QGI25_11110 [Arenicellales bacterium]|jgi:hypothetical protein|nr:hypothetical protein [Arenicellales bacterium]|tara:strand:+ start:151 stop:300 length:150 start_codon:yes stop_codon:yes gene_type:complete
MTDVKRLATFFGWCTVLNVGILILAAVAWVLVGPSVSSIGASMMNITAE